MHLESTTTTKILYNLYKGHSLVDLKSATSNDRFKRFNVAVNNLIEEDLISVTDDQVTDRGEFKLMYLGLAVADKL